MKDKITMTPREVSVLIEELRSEFRVFGDGLKTIASTIKGIETTVAKNWEKLTGIDLRTIRVEKKLEDIDKRLTSVESPK